MKNAKFECLSYCELNDTFDIKVSFENASEEITVSAAAAAVIFAPVVSESDDLPFDLVGKTI